MSVGRSNSGNLHMMLEELNADLKVDKYYVAKCIHLDIDQAGTPFKDSLLNHIDIALNVYDKKSFEKRMNQSLIDGKVVDTNMRTHLLRFEKVPLIVNCNCKLNTSVKWQQHQAA